MSVVKSTPYPSTVTVGPPSGWTQSVTVTIPASAAAGGKLFCRLKDGPLFLQTPNSCSGLEVFPAARSSNRPMAPWSRPARKAIPLQPRARPGMLRCFTMWIGLTAATVCAQLPTADIQGDGEWLPFASKTLDSRSDYTVNPANLERSKYGGWKARRHDQGTGFFRAEKINGRWWCIDPEGYLYIHLALNSVSLEHQTADEIYTMMREYGFNGFGNWTQDDPLPGRSVVRESTVKGITPMAYTPRVLFIATYRNSRLPAGTPRIELPVFDPGFETKAFEIANGFLPYVNDPHVFGYFSDNELPFNEVLQAHLGITNQNDPNYLAAFNFLATRGKTPANWDEADSDAYTALAGERYFSVVKRAIRSVDTNHMYLGSRCHSREKGNQAFMENAGEYVDIFSANHYHHWGDRRIATKNMAEWLGRPLMFTEFYVKSVADVSDSSSGAGFKGRNETSRALFYQNFVSTHVESGSLVGFHWFKYADSGGSELGVINESGVLYTGLLNSMKQINTRIYDFIDGVDTRPAPDATLNPEADAHFEGGANRGGSSNLQVKFASSPSFSTFRQTYMRFDVSSLGNQIDSAKIVLRTVESGGIGIFRVELVEDDSWGEATIRNSNAPAGSTVLQTFSDGRSDLEIDVFSVIRREVEGDGKLSIRIIATGNYNWIPTYGSRENPDPLARPVLNINYTAIVTDPFQSWIDPFNVADESKGGDPDNDEIGNLMEFVLNGKPGISDTKILPDMAPNSTDFTFIYVRRVDSVGVPQVVQYGFNLTEWTDVAIPTAVGSTTVGAASVTVGAPASGTQTVTVSIPRSGPEIGKLFGRLKVGP